MKTSTKSINTWQKPMGVLLALFILAAGCQPNPQNTLTPNQMATGESRTATTISVPTAPQKLCIYYSWPSVVNGSNGDVTKATTEFAKFDVIVLGDGLWKTTHGDNAKTKLIIAALRKLKPAVKIFGYIDLGVKTQNLTEAQLKTAIDGWKLMGATGVFGDDYGADYGVTRARQNTFVDYAHGKSLGVFANAWAINDALGGTDCHLDSRDYYLLESFCVGWGVYRPLDEFKARGDLAYYYMKQKQVSIAAVATTTFKLLSASTPTSTQFLQSWYGAALYNFDAFQFTDKDYSANSTTGSNGKVFAFANPLTTYGTSWKEADWVVKVSPTLYKRSTNTHTLYISGDGSTTGTGYNTKP